MDNLTYLEFEKKIKEMPIVLFPIGAYEQHGSAGNLGTDYIIADYFAKEVSNRTNIIKVPCLPFGYSSIHKSFAGTISLTDEIYEEVIKCIITNLKDHGVKKIFLINGHGGNKIPLKSILEDESIILYEWFNETKNVFFATDHKSHACSEEMSVLGAINKKYVTESSLQNMIPSNCNIDWRSMKIDDRRIEFVSKNGVLGKVNGFNIKKGEEIIDFVVGDIIQKIDIIIKEMKI